MSRLVIGDHVMQRKGGREGKLVEIDGATGYVMQANGVEIEFPLDQLMPFDVEGVKSARAASAPAKPFEKRLSPAHQALLNSVPAAIIAAITRNYDRAAPPIPFGDLSDLKKLGVVRIYLPQVEHRLLVDNMKLVVAMRELGKSGS